MEQNEKDRSTVEKLQNIHLHKLVTVIELYSKESNGCIV